MVCRDRARPNGRASHDRSTCTIDISRGSAVHRKGPRQITWSESALAGRKHHFRGSPDRRREDLSRSRRKSGAVGKRTSPEAAARRGVRAHQSPHEQQSKRMITAHGAHVRAGLSCRSVTNRECRKCLSGVKVVPERCVDSKL